MPWRLVVMIIVAIGMIALQSLLHWAVPFLVVPDFTLILVVFLAFYEVHQWGALSVFVIGLLFDMSSGVLLGPRAGAGVVVFGFLASMSQRIFIESPLAAMVCVWCASLINHFVYVILVFEFKQDEVITLSHFLGVSVLVEALVTALVAPPIMALLRRAYSRSGVQSSNRAMLVKQR